MYTYIVYDYIVCAPLAAPQPPPRRPGARRRTPPDRATRRFGGPTLPLLFKLLKLFKLSKSVAD